MQTLGLSDSTPRTESRWRALFWPTIRNESDLDYVTRQGFWICFLVAVATLVVAVFTGSAGWGLFESAFFFLAGVGMRERSRVAGVAVFAAYLLSSLVMARYTGGGVGVVRVIFAALLLANVRGTWLAARWVSTSEDMPPRLSETLGDKLTDRLPALLWPKTRYLFYVLAALELGFLSIALSAPRAGVS